MNSELTNSLNGFASSVNSLVPVTLILQIMAIGVGIAFSYYIIVWGAKCIIRAVKNGLNGYFTDPTSYEFRNSARAKRIAQKHGYLLYDDMIQAQQFGYTNAHDYYVDYSHYEAYEFDDISNSAFREFLERPLRGSIDDDLDDDYDDYHDDNYDDHYEDTYFKNRSYYGKHYLKSEYDELSDEVYLYDEENDLYFHGNEKDILYEKGYVTDDGDTLIYFGDYDF